MNGDLGNLLTGEMGEAEARFADDDFAEAYGSRVMGRVRRRRTVRVVGVGGGTVLTAGALALGATHMPWGVLGAAPGGGTSAGEDCATPSPVTGQVNMMVTSDGKDGAPTTIVMTNPKTGTVTMRGVEQPDGTYLFSDAAGNQLRVELGPSGGYIVQLPDATTGRLWSSEVHPGSSTGGTVAHATVAPEGAAAPSASDGCYTPSPTP